MAYCTYGSRVSISSRARTESFADLQSLIGFVAVFIDTYHFELYQEGLSFLGILVGAFVVIPPFFLYLKYKLEPQFDENGEIQPEKRLPPTFVGTLKTLSAAETLRRIVASISTIDGSYSNIELGAFCIPICLFWFGWSARPDVHWSEYC